MPNTIQKTKQIYSKTNDGSLELIETQIIEVEELTQEEIIAEKEAQLLKMYQEIEALKNKQ